MSPADRDPAALAAPAAELAARLPGQVERAVPSAAFTTYRCGGPLAVLVRCRSEADVQAVAAVVAPAGAPCLVIGRGSNLLVADRGFAGVAVVLEGELESCAVDPSSETVTTGGALALPVLARRTAAAGLTGLEFFVGIPGSVGGAVRMNAGGHGRSTAEVVVDARVTSLAGGPPRLLDPSALGFGYRRSSLGRDDVVVAATWRVAPDDPAACARRVDEIVRWRREHQPGGQNAGSVFVNPPGDSAGRLIDACGLKGHRVGGASVSEKHANFFVADPGARADDVRALVVDVARRVEEATGVRLRPEVHFVGYEGVS